MSRVHPAPTIPHPALVDHARQRAENLQNRIADRITRYAGSMHFVYLHIALFALWMVLIEESPWPTLTLIVSLEAIFLSTFVMISQNRADEKRQVMASQEWQSVQLEETQNEQLLDLSKQILELTDAIHRLTVEHTRGPVRGRRRADTPARLIAPPASSSRMTTLRAAPDTVRNVDGGWWDRLRRVDPRIWDALLALGAVVLGVLAFALREQRPDEPPAALGFALVVVAGSSLAWRRRAPLTVATIVSAAVATAALFGYWPEFVALLWIAVYSAAAYTERDRLIRVLLPVAVLTSIAISIGERWDRGLNWIEILTDLIVTFGVPFLLGRMTFNRRRRIVREREVATREAVAAERAAIARELHDVVAHHMSVMVVQAGAARAVGETDPAATAEALRQIEASGRTGLAEMRRLLEVLKAEEDGDGRAPQPGLARLNELLDAMRASGLPVEAVVEGTPRALSPGVDLSAYRIVQEALTNSLRHAGGASARVVVRYEPDALELEIADDGPGPPEDPEASGGHGLIGMRERVQLFGGELEAGPRPGGGFLVVARLPSEPA